MRLWLIRHALVDAEARARLYGQNDVPVCETTMTEQHAQYRALAHRLPREVAWYVTPLSRTRRTAEAIFAHGYAARPLDVEPGLIEQSLGDWHGLAHAELPALLAHPAHPHWPLAARECPPGGESMDHVIARVGTAIDALAQRHPHDDVVCVSHGGAIRAAVAHAMSVDGHAALHLSVWNLSTTILERTPAAWRIVAVNVPAHSQGA